MSSMGCETECSREQEIRARYGEILTVGDLAEILKYPSAQALRKAHSRGRLPIKLLRFPNRKGYFATAKMVAEVLDSLEREPSQNEDDAMKRP